MDSKTLVSFEFKKEDRIYSMQVPAGAPLGEAYEAASHFLTAMVKLINDNAKQLEKKEPEGDLGDKKEE